MARGEFTHLSSSISCISCNGTSACELKSLIVVKWDSNCETRLPVLRVAQVVEALDDLEDASVALFRIPSPY